MSNIDVIRRVEKPSAEDIAAGAEYGITEFAEQISTGVYGDNVVITRTLWEGNPRTKDPRGNRHLGVEALVTVPLSEAHKLVANLAGTLGQAAVKNREARA